MSAAATRRLVATRDIAVDHPAFPGHFPGQPLLPGVSLLAEVMEVAMADPVLAARLAAGFSLNNAKFLAPVGPGARLLLTLDADDAGLRFEVERAGVCAARGQIAWSAS